MRKSGSAIKTALLPVVLSGLCILTGFILDAQLTHAKYVSFLMLSMPGSHSSLLEEQFRVPDAVLNLKQFAARNIKVRIPERCASVLRYQINVDWYYVFVDEEGYILGTVCLLAS